MTLHPAVRFLVRASVFVCVGWSLCHPSAAADWPQWRGPNRDGISAEKGWTTKWPEKGPKMLWKAKVANGHSSLAVVGGRVYTMGFELDKPGPDGKYQKNEDGRRLGTDIVWCGSYPRSVFTSRRNPLPAAPAAVSINSVSAT